LNDEVYIYVSQICIYNLYLNLLGLVLQTYKYSNVHWFQSNSVIAFMFNCFGECDMYEV